MRSSPGRGRNQGEHFWSVADSNWRPNPLGDGGVGNRNCLGELFVCVCVRGSYTKHFIEKMVSLSKRNENANGIVINQRLKRETDNRITVTSML